MFFKYYLSTSFVMMPNFFFFSFQKPQMRPMIAEYDPKKKGVRNDLSDVVMVK